MKRTVAIGVSASTMPIPTPSTKQRYVGLDKMKHYIPYARSDVSNDQVKDVVEWLGANELLAKMRQLPPE